MARELRLSPKTASTYKTRIMQKLNLQSDDDLIRYALANHLVK
ncbi:MAG TPA: LuxR C-terminal-related transcriptional regulator [Burkholderiales bacterium]|nr:LuxR C-terminal-related transcriptional regulator [Burkholderiales bacterium]